MSMISDVLKPRRSPTGPKAPTLFPKVRAAEVRLAELEAQRPTLALEAVEGVLGAADRLADLSDRIQRARVDLSDLTDAHSAAKAQDAEAERAQRAHLHKTQLAAVRNHLAARDAAAEALSAALAEAAKQYKIVWERSEKAAAANPIGGSWPSGAMTGFDELKRATQHELFRLSSDGSVSDHRVFPGAEAPSGAYFGSPEKVTPLATVLKDASAYAIKVLTGRE